MSALLLFDVPVDVTAFEECFGERFHPLLLRIPRLKELTVNRVGGAGKGVPSFYMVVEALFSTEEAMQEGLNSEEGQAVARDMGLFASGGVTVLFCQRAVDLSNQQPPFGANLAPA